MKPTKLNRVDLNLFVVFDAIYRQGSLTKAAEVLYLSQPAVSHALARLREQFNDPLFERQGKGVAPTPLAKNIIERVRFALQELEGTLQEDLDFNAKDSKRIFNFGARDMLETIALPLLMQTLEQQAPHVQVHSVRVARRELERSLTSGQIDLAADVLLPVSQEIEHQKIAEEPLVVAMRKEHPLAKVKWNLEAYLQAKHVQVSSRTSGLGVEDFALTKLGVARQILLRCQNYQAAVEVIRQSDFILTLPQSVAKQLVDFEIRPLPLEQQPLELYLYWHKKAEQDPAVMWLKEQMVKVFRG